MEVSVSDQHKETAMKRRGTEGEGFVMAEEDGHASGDGGQAGEAGLATVHALAPVRELRALPPADPARPLDAAIQVVGGWLREAERFEQAVYETWMQALETSQLLVRDGIEMVSRVGAAMQRRWVEQMEQGFALLGGAEGGGLGGVSEREVVGDGVEGGAGGAAAGGAAAGLASGGFFYLQLSPARRWRYESLVSD